MIKKTKGIALGTVLVVLTFMIFLGTGMALLSHTAIRGSRVVHEVDVEWYALEGGLLIAASRIYNYVNQLSREALSPHFFAAYTRMAGAYGANMRDYLNAQINSQLTWAQNSLQTTMEEGLTDAWQFIQEAVSENPINEVFVQLNNLDPIGEYLTITRITPGPGQGEPYFIVELDIAVHTARYVGDDLVPNPIELRARVSFRITTHSHYERGFTHRELLPDFEPAGPNVQSLAAVQNTWRNAHGNFMGRLFSTSLLVYTNGSPDPNVQQFSIGVLRSPVMRGANDNVPLISYLGPIGGATTAGSDSIPLLFNYFSSPVSFLDVLYMGTPPFAPDPVPDLASGRTLPQKNILGNAAIAMWSQNQLQYGPQIFGFGATIFDNHGGWRSFASRLVFGIHYRLELRSNCPSAFLTFNFSCPDPITFCFGTCLQTPHINSDLLQYNYVDLSIMPAVINTSVILPLPVGSDYAVFGTLAFDILRPQFRDSDLQSIFTYGRPDPLSVAPPLGTNPWSLQEPLDLPPGASTGTGPQPPLTTGALMSSLLSPTAISPPVNFSISEPQGRANRAEDVLLQLALLRTVNQVVNHETIFGPQMGLPTPPVGATSNNLVEIWQNPTTRYAEHIVVHGDLYITPRYCTCTGDCPDPPALPGFISPGSYNCDIMYFPNLRWLEVTGDVIVQFYDVSRSNALSPDSVNSPIRVVGRWDDSGNVQRLFELNPGQTAYRDDRGTVITATNVFIERHPLYPVELWNLHIHATNINMNTFFDIDTPTPTVFTFDRANRNDTWWLRSNSTFVASNITNIGSLQSMWVSGWNMYGFYPVYSRIGEPLRAPQFFSRVMNFYTRNPSPYSPTSLCRPTYAFFAAVATQSFVPSADNFVNLSGFTRHPNARNRADVITPANPEHNRWIRTGYSQWVTTWSPQVTTASNAIFTGFQPMLPLESGQNPPIVPRIAFSTLPSPFAYHFVNVIHERTTTAFFVDERRVPVIEYQAGIPGVQPAVFTPDPSHWLFPHIGQTWGEVLNLSDLFGGTIPPRVLHWYQHLRILPDWTSAGRDLEGNDPFTFQDLTQLPPTFPTNWLNVNGESVFIEDDLAMQDYFRVNLWPTGTPLRLYPHDARIGKYGMDFRQAQYLSVFPPGWAFNFVPPGSLTPDPDGRMLSFTNWGGPGGMAPIWNFNIPGQDFHYMPPNQLDSIFNHNNRDRHFLYRTLNDIPLPGAVLSPRHSYLVFTFDRPSDFRLTIR